MGRASVVITNNALVGSVSASSQELAMGPLNLLTPHPSERWRSKTNNSWFTLDKGEETWGDTVFVKGMTCGKNAQVRIKMFDDDNIEVASSGWLTDGSSGFDTDYGAVCYLLDELLLWRYTTVEINDPDADYVEAGAIVDGLRETLIDDFNFAPGASVKYIDRTRVSQTGAGWTLTWEDNWFRRIDLSFEAIPKEKRYGLFETMDRICGRRVNVLLILDPASDNLARDCFYGLMTDTTPVSFSAAIDIFGKQIQMDERV